MPTRSDRDPNTPFPGQIDASDDCHVSQLISALDTSLPTIADTPSIDDGYRISGRSSVVENSADPSLLILGITSPEDGKGVGVELRLALIVSLNTYSRYPNGLFRHVCRAIPRTD